MTKKNEIAYRLLRMCWIVLSYLPFWFHYAISDCFYILVRYIVRYRLAIVRKNISTSFPEKSTAEVDQIANNFYRWFCDYLVETVKLSSLSSSQLKKRMIFTGTELIDRYISEGRSCALYLGHYGQWEWITSLPHWLQGNGQCTQIYHPLENPIFDKLFQVVRERNGSKCISMQEVLRKTVSFKQQGQPIIMGYIADQAPNWFNIHHWVNFLNHDTPVFTGTERIIKKFNQVAFYGTVSRTKRGYYRCDFKLLTDNAQSFDDFSITDMYFRALENDIRKSPELYLWSHNRFKRTREEYNLRYDKDTGKIDMSELSDIIRRKNERQQQ